MHVVDEHAATPRASSLFVTPNVSSRALMELIVSPPALARPRTCAFDDCACKQERREVRRRQRVRAPCPAPGRRSPSRRPTVFFFERLAECVVGGQEVPSSCRPCFTTAEPSAFGERRRYRTHSESCTACIARWSACRRPRPMLMYTLCFSASDGVHRKTSLPSSCRRPADRRPSRSNHSRAREAAISALFW